MVCYHGEQAGIKGEPALLISVMYGGFVYDSFTIQDLVTTTGRGSNVSS